MKLIIPIIGFLYLIQIAYGQQTKKRLVCYYDSESSTREGNAKFSVIHLKKALPHCTHLMYGYADLNPKTYELSNVKLLLNITSLKKEFPNLKIFLSLGGDKDIDKVDSEKYMHFLEAGKLKYYKFIRSSMKFLKSHNFDGLDLAFQFPRNKPQKVHTVVDMVVKKLEKLFSGDIVVDPNADKHKEQYSEFVGDLRKSYNKERLSLAMTILPNVNSTWYFDIPEIQNNFDFINLFAFDFLTPTRNPEVADYTAPIYLENDQNRLPFYTIDYQVNYWISNGCPANKLNIGIATYGRAWKLTIDSGLSGTPVIENTNGPAEKGNQTKTAGLLSYSEICFKISKREALKYADRKQKYGNHAFKPSDRFGNHGIWISFDDPEFAAVKADYVNSKNLGGVALYDLSLDDFRSHCSVTRFPILKSVSQKLKISNQKLSQTRYSRYRY